MTILLIDLSSQNGDIFDIDIETLKDYKVKVGDKTFVVSAKSPKDAKNKVKSKLGE